MENAQSRPESCHRKTAPSTFDERIARLKEIQRGWINYFRMASMQTKLKATDSWLRNRLRYCIWEDWKKPDRRRKNLIRLGIRNGQAYAWSRTRMGGCPPAGGSKSYFRHNDHAGKISQERLRVHAVLLRKSISTI